MSEYSFNDQKTIDVFQKSLDRIIKENDSPGAYLFFWRLQNLLNNPKLSSILDNSVLQQYQLMVLKAKFLALYKLDDDEAINLINEHFNLIIDIKFYDLLEKIDQFLVINKYFAIQRDEFKDKLRKVLLESKTRITKHDLKINNKDYSPTISNWLRGFRNQFTEDGFRDKVKITQYFSSGQNVLNLNDSEKKKLKILINLYAYLKVSSLSLEGIEEHISIKTSDGSSAIFAKGRIEKIPQAVINIFNEVQKKIGGELYRPPHEDRNRVQSIMDSKQSRKVFELPKEENGSEFKPPEKKDEKKSVEKLLESYRSFEMDLKSIDVLIKALGEYKNKPQKLFSKFNQDLEDKKRDNLLANLVFICQSKLLNKFLNENKKLLVEFKEYLSFKFTADIVKTILDNSSSPETVSLYLQFILFKKLKLSPRNAGLFGMHLANVLKKVGQQKYFPMVYGDVNLEQFVWREVIEENGLVKFK